MITAPFNFVPLNEKVFFPSWAEDVSLDVPFEDGESGEIDITLTAKSPIFIRDHQNPEEFCQHNGQYYIPGSSVKGMVRNVLEIMSFSKLKIDTKQHSKITSIRDMTNSKELVGIATGCGFLKKDYNNKWIIVDYGKPRTIEYTDNNKIIRNGNSQINCDFEAAKDKYDANELYLVLKVQTDIKDLKNRDGKKIGTKKIATISNHGEEAYLVLTGGIDNKKNEFVLASSDRKDKTINNIDKAVSKFEDVYFNSDSIDGNFWKNNWDKNIGIPIFYIKNKNDNVTNIGLSQLFKLAYNHTIKEATKQVTELIDIKKEGNKVEKDVKLDLSETIFGAIREKASALKGRVQFSHFKCDSIPKKYQKITTVLGSPNPSFYPEYIQQNCKNNGKVENDKYNTLMDKLSKISGWKRYPSRNGKPHFKKAEEGTDSATAFTPLGNYNDNNFNEFTFSGKVRFHNLKKAELGALISSITFHNNQDSFYHNIGMAKSLGFGKIKINMEISKYNEALQEFEIVMNEWSKEKNKTSWIDTEQMKELFTMAFKNLNIDAQLKYLELDPDKKINEFVDAKNLKLHRDYVGRDCLPKVSKMFDLGDNYPKTLLTDEVLQERAKKREKEKRRQEHNNKLKEAQNTDNIQIIKNFIAEYPEDENAKKLQEKVDSIDLEQKANKHAEVNIKVKSAYEALLKKKGTKGFTKDCDKFIKKWKAEKNNKGSNIVLEYVDKVKNH